MIDFGDQLMIPGLHDAHLYGTLAPNLFADICVMDHNLLECQLEEILETSCVMTMVGGKIVYRK